MISIDGSIGEGGGQILRTALGLSLITGKPFTIEKIRARRSKPGLLRQHLTAVEAAKTIGQGQASGHVIGSPTLTFIPGNVIAGEYHFSVGTAGSATLVLQTILPALMIADAPSTITIEGGTHNPYAPPFDFLQKVFVPVLKHMGVGLELKLHRHGFYPAGGGKMEVKIVPSRNLKKISLLEPGELRNMKAIAMFAQIPANVALRELTVVKKHLSLGDDNVQVFEVKDSQGPGNILTIEIQWENMTEMVTAFGELRKSAETVAHESVNFTKKYLQANVSVGVYLADQLLIPLALARGGEFLTVKPSLHTSTNISIIEKFLNVNFNLSQVADDQWRVEVSC